GKAFTRRSLFVVYLALGAWALASLAGWSRYAGVAVACGVLALGSASAGLARATLRTLPTYNPFKVRGAVLPSDGAPRYRVALGDGFLERLGRCEPGEELIFFLRALGEVDLTVRAGPQLIPVDRGTHGLFLWSARCPEEARQALAEFGEVTVEV